MLCQPTQRTHKKLFPKITFKKGSNAAQNPVIGRFMKSFFNTIFLIVYWHYGSLLGHNLRWQIFGLFWQPFLLPVDKSETGVIIIPARPLAISHLSPPVRRFCIKRKLILISCSFIIQSQYCPISTIQTPHTSIIKLTL